jgi:uncharacterized membrane protein
METHEHLGLLVLLLAIILSLWRIILKKKLAGKLWLAYLALSIIMVVVMSFGADFGGLMVYTHGVGVKANSTGDGAIPINKDNAKANSPHDSTPHKH